MTYLMQQFGDELSDIQMRNIDSDSLHEIIGEFAPLLGVAVNDRQKTSATKETFKDEVDGSTTTIEPVKDQTFNNVKVKLEADGDLVKDGCTKTSQGLTKINKKCVSENEKEETMVELSKNEFDNYVEVKVEVDDDLAKEMYNEPAPESSFPQKRKLCNTIDNGKRLDQHVNNKDSALMDKLVCKIQSKKSRKANTFLQPPVKMAVSVKQEILNVPVISPSSRGAVTKSDSQISMIDSTSRNSESNADEVESKKKPYKCKVCSKRYDTGYHLNRHIITHDGMRPYACDKCSKAFTQKCDLTRHMHVHNEERAFVCKVCGKSFKRSDYLSKHERRYCTLQRDRRCSKCDKLFDSESELRAHKCSAVKVGVTFTCEHCEETFTTVETLVEHRKVHVKNEQEHQCIRCKEKFSDFMAYVDHFRYHNTDRPYTCDLCQKTFSRNHNLMTHMWIHNTEKQYTCQICAKTFTYFSNLQVHLRVHRNERPYICLECDKGFLTSSDLRRHQRTHSGEKPYKCPHCSSKYARKERLISHLLCHMEDGEGSRGDDDTKAQITNGQDSSTATPFMLISLSDPVANGTGLSNKQSHSSANSISSPLFLSPAQSVETKTIVSPINGKLAMQNQKSTSIYSAPVQNQSIQHVQTKSKISNNNGQPLLVLQKGSSDRPTLRKSEKSEQSYREMSPILLNVKQESDVMIKQEPIDPEYAGQPVNAVVKQEPVDKTIVKQEPVN